ncbi:unnamed protein product [Lathyrus sativus]|nr:unnamed protein product [Lathyrus sativus]
MALRPIDNALPTITQERPKKQPKIAVAAQKQQQQQQPRTANDENQQQPRTANDENQQQPRTANDENQQLLRTANDENQVPSEPTVDYISSDNLKPMSDPEAQIQSLIEDLDSKNWVKVCESLNDVRRFALYHSSLLLPILDKILLVVVKSMKNPRSALCKTSIMAASDIFNAFGDKLFDPSTSDAFEDLLLQLLLKASQDKRFVCEEAERALGSMVGSMTPLSLLQKLRVSVSHKNLRIRAKAAVSLSKCVSKMVNEEMEEFGMEKLIEVAADLVNDRLPEARDAARSIATSVYEAITKDVEVEEKMEVWQSFCHSKLTPINAISILKIVKV